MTSFRENRAPELVILTGAGISAESGLGTFRDKDGLWTKFDLEEVATPQGFAKDPKKVHDFYNARRRNAAEAEPNAAHFALADLENAFGPRVMLVTQNVDDLHERAGSKHVWHMHGALKDACCASCAHRYPSPMVMAAHDPCPSCAAPATRPDIVWFGEMPMFMDDISAALERCAMFVAIGTSGTVYPAAGFAAEARANGAETVELNLEPSGVASDFLRGQYGPASEIVPAWTKEMLSQFE